jgi:hypothetical protein
MAKRKKTVNFNIPTSPISLNNEDYSLTVQIIRDVLDVGEKDNNSFTQILLNDMIKEYRFTSDLVFPIITGELVFQDQGSFLFSKITGDGRTFLNFTLEKVGLEANNVSESIQKFDHLFMITKIDMLERLTDESTYRISFVSSQWYNFNNYLNYTSEGEKPILKILEEIIKAGGLSLTPNEETRQVNRSQFFITPTSFNLLDSIRYLLSIGIDSENGFYFFTHDHIENNYSITSLKQLYTKLRKDEEGINPNNILIMPSNHYLPTGATGRQGIHEFKELNVNGADVTTELLKPFSFQTYNYIGREFQEIQVNFNKLRETLPEAQRKTYRNNLNPPVKEATDIALFNYQREKNPINSFIWYFSTAQIFMWNRVVEFKTFGSMERKAGDVIYITIPEADEHHESISGYWYVLRVGHEFNKRSYYNKITACRIDEKIVQTNKQFQSQQGTPSS